MISDERRRLLRQLATSTRVIELTNATLLALLDSLEEAEAVAVAALEGIAKESGNEVVTNQAQPAGGLHCAGCGRSAGLLANGVGVCCWGEE